MIYTLGYGMGKGCVGALCCAVRRCRQSVSVFLLVLLSLCDFTTNFNFAACGRSAYALCVCVSVCDDDVCSPSKNASLCLAFRLVRNGLLFKYRKECRRVRGACLECKYATIE